jgi:hypothetical protein
MAQAKYITIKTEFEDIDNYCYIVALSFHHLQKGIWSLNNCEFDIDTEILEYLINWSELTYITSLELVGNNIDDEGAIHIAKAIKNNISLRRVNLNSNKIGMKGVFALADAIRANKKLEFFSIQNNSFNDPVHCEDSIEAELALEDAIKFHPFCNKDSIKSELTYEEAIELLPFCKKD